MKILFYLTGGFDHHGPSNHLLKSLIISVLENNHSVHIIERHTTGQFHDMPKEIVIHKNLTYAVIKSSIENKKHFIRRYLIYVIYAFKSIKHLRRNKDSDVVFVQSCATAPFQITFAKWFTKKPIIYNVQDMFPGSSIATGVMRNKLIKGFFYNFQRIAYSKANHIVAISQDMKDKLTEQKVHRNKISVIENWYDDTYIKVIDDSSNTFIKKYGIDKSKFIIQYAGGMGYVFDYKTIVSIACALKKYENIEFHMIGNGSRLEDFQNEVKKQNLNNVLFFPMQPQEEVASVYSAADVCLIPLVEGVIGNSVPSKISLVMACKTVPITIVEKSKYYDMFNENEIGFCFAHDEIDKAILTILDLYKNENKRIRLSENAYSYSRNMYNKEKSINHYIDIFKSVGDES